MDGEIQITGLMILWDFAVHGQHLKPETTQWFFFIIVSQSVDIHPPVSHNVLFKYWEYSSFSVKHKYFLDCKAVR